MRNIVKKNKYIIVGIGILVLIIIFLIIRTNKYNLNVSLSDEEKFKDDYESLNNLESSDDRVYPTVNISYDNIKYVSIDEALDILDKDTGVIYIGYPECIYCRVAVQVLLDTAKGTKLDNIYYLDISDVWDIKELDKNNKVVTKKEANDKYNKLLDELGDLYLVDYKLKDKKGNEVDVGEKRVNVPTVIFVVNGDIVSGNVGTLFSQDDPYEKLNDDQIKGLSEIYNYGINDVLKAK